MKKVAHAFVGSVVVVGFIEVFRSAIAAHAGWPMQIIGTSAVLTVVLLMITSRAKS